MPSSTALTSDAAHSRTAGDERAERLAALTAFKRSFGELAFAYGAAVDVGSFLDLSGQPRLAAATDLLAEIDPDAPSFDDCMAELSMIFGAVEALVEFANLRHKEGRAKSAATVRHPVPAARVRLARSRARSSRRDARCATARRRAAKAGSSSSGSGGSDSDSPGSSGVRRIVGALLGRFAGPSSGVIA